MNMFANCSAKPTSTASVSGYTSGECPINKKQRVESNGESSSDTNRPIVPTISGDLSRILSKFECCVCLEYISPPILQCPNSHLFCLRCRQQLKAPEKCPNCQQTLPESDSRCLTLEQLAVDLGLPFPCKYSSSGCSVTSLLTEKKNHENLCEFRHYKCWECEGREWFGDKQQMFQHLIDIHQYVNQDLDSESNNVVIMIDHFCREEWTQWYELVTFNGQHFVLFVIRDYNEHSEDHIVKFKAHCLLIW